MEEPPMQTTKKEQKISQIKVELLALEEQDRQAREEMRRATEAAEKLSRKEPTNTTPAPEILGEGDIEEINLSPWSPAGAESIPKTPEEKEVLKEIENLSPEVREKIGWGLATIGFKFEIIKDNVFASALSPFSKSDSKGTVSRFCKELKDSFVRDAEKVAKKAQSKGWAKQFGDKAILLGNVLKYGRIIADITGASIANPFRYAMMGGMAAARLGEAGKETRLKNEEVMEKTRIQEADRAAEEAWGIYKRAIDENGAENVTAEALKNAYMMEMPTDLLERLKNTTAAKGFIQRNLRRRLEVDINHINDSLEKIYNNPKLSPSEKKEQETKIILKQRKNLEDYDRMLTQYGTVDELAMAARYAQKAGKGIVLGMQIETALISIEKLAEMTSSLWHHSHDVHEIVNPNNFLRHPSSVMESAHKMGDIKAAPDGSAPEIFHAEGVTFDHGHGAIWGIKHLQDQLNEQFHGDFSKAPPGIRAFMEDPTKEAIKLGFYDPSNPNESALIKAGSVLKFDEHGNLLFGQPDASGNIPTLEKYHGTMFDSDHSAHIAPKTLVSEHAPAPESVHHTGESVFRQKLIMDKELASQHRLPAFDQEHPAHTEEAIKKGIVDKMHEEATKSQPRPAGINRFYGTSNQAGYGTNYVYGTGPGHPYPYGNGFNGEHLNQFPAEFADNPYNLSEDKLMQVYEAHQENISILFGHESSNAWGDLKDLTAKSVIKQADITTNDPAFNSLADYLQMLKNFTHLRPRSGFLGLNPESVEHWEARALQKLEAEGKLEVFEDSVRK